MVKVELTPEKLAELRQKAKAAETQGRSPWKSLKTVDEYRVFCEVRDNCGLQVVADSTAEESEHIAAADPATVLALVEEIELLRKRLSWFPAHMMEKINRAIAAHTQGMADAHIEHCRCDDTVGYHCDYCVVHDALISCKNLTKSEAGQ